MYNNNSGVEENIIPDAAGLYSSISNQGYSNVVAIADLIDNSIDAGASNIWLSIDNNLKTIIITDDGCGMSMDDLNRALKLGGKKAHNSEGDLGKFGMGLVSASLSMGSRIKIITKQDGIYNTGITDQEEILRTNSFFGRFYESTESEVDSFNERTENAESGTILIIDKCNNMQYNSATDLIDKLMEFIGEVFRAFIRNGKNIYINNARVRINDPLMLDNPKTIKIYEDDIEVGLLGGKTEAIHLLAVKLPDLGQSMNRKAGINITNQGFYVLRNGREIAKALEFPGVFVKHNDLNSLRIELSFNSSLDDLMGVNSRKQDINPKTSVENDLKRALKDPIDLLRKEIKAKQKANSAKTNPFKTQETGGGSATVISSPTTTPAPYVAPVMPVAPVEEKEYDYVVSSYAGNADDPLFKVSVMSNKITVRLNISHPYYAERILGANSIELKVALNNTITAAARAFVDTCGVAKLGIFAEKFARGFDKTEN